MKKICTIILFSGLSSALYADYWTQLANFPSVGRQLASGFSIGTKGYITCGDGAGYMNDLWEYDPPTNVWTQKANLPGAGRYGAVVFVINDRGYIGTGAYPLLDDLWEYDPASNSWTQMASITGARGFAVGFAIGTKGYIGCGMGISDFWEWDQPTNTWTQKTSCPVNRQQSVAFAINGKGYFTTGSYLNDLWEYNPVTDSWLQKASLPGPGRVDATGFVICDKGYVGSGGDGPLMDDFWEYDPVLDQWTQKTNTPGGLRDDCPSFAIGQKGYFGLGDNGSYQVDFWEYTPDQCVNIPPVAAFSAPNHICPGTCTNFNNLSINATSYVWIFPGASPGTSTDINPANICYNTPGVYPVTLIASNLTSDDTLVLNNYITVYPYPPAQGIQQSGDTLFANAGASSYQWYYDGILIPGATDFFYVVAQGGDYSVVATDGNGCEVEAVIFDVIESVPALSNDLAVSIFPNPVSDFMNVVWPGLGEGAFRITVYSLTGEAVMVVHPVVRANDKTVVIDISRLAAAAYHVAISDGRKSFHGRFVKTAEKKTD